MAMMSNIQQMAKIYLCWSFRIREAKLLNLQLKPLLKVVLSILQDIAQSCESSVILEEKRERLEMILEKIFPVVLGEWRDGSTTG